MKNKFFSVVLLACLICITSCSAQPLVTSQTLSDTTKSEQTTVKTTVMTETSQAQDTSSTVALDQAHARSVFVQISILLDVFGEDIQSGESTAFNVPADIDPFFHRDSLMKADDSISYLITEKKCVSATYNGQTFNSDGNWSPANYVPRSSKTVDASKVDAFALAECVNGTIAVKAGDVVSLSGTGDTLPQEIKAYFGTLSDNETWSFETNGLDVSATCNGQTSTN